MNHEIQTQSGGHNLPGRCVKIFNMSSSPDVIRSIRGGIGASKEATDEIHEICKSMKAVVEAKQNKKFTEFTAKSFKTQVVAGVNYFIKVNVGNEHLHLRVYKPLKGDMQLTNVQNGKTETDDIQYF